MRIDIELYGNKVNSHGTPYQTVVESVKLEDSQVSDVEAKAIFQRVAQVLQQEWAKSVTGE